MDSYYWNDARESKLQHHANGARFIHLATHGFFDPRRVEVKIASLEQNASDLMRHTRQESVLGYEAEFLSGIGLAGANIPISGHVFQWSDQPVDDGRLTAAEVSGLNLENTELVVISACDTSIGKGAGMEGMLGLQRAFGVAGADTVISTLWKVDDQATKSMMLEFYRNLWEEKLSKLESLRQA